MYIDSIDETASAAGAPVAIAGKCVPVAVALTAVTFALAQRVEQIAVRTGLAKLPSESLLASWLLSENKIT